MVQSHTGAGADSPREPRGRRRLAFATASLAIGVVVAAALAAVLAPASEAAEAAWRGRCVNVLDGDSIEVVSDGRTHEIRLDGIDAPERGQALSTRAKETLAGLIEGRDVTVTGKTTDQYGRLVARVHVSGVDTSLEMIRQGLAWHYKRYSSERALADAEAVARARRVGVWADPAAVPPWSYRRGSSGPTPSAPPITRSSESPSATLGEVRGNTSSRVFHTASCTNFGCRNCTARFPDADAARAAGYRPAGCCHPSRR